MSNPVTCSSCGTPIPSADEHRGQHISCPQCGATISVRASFSTSTARRRSGAISRPRTVSVLAVYNVVQGVFAIIAGLSPDSFFDELGVGPAVMAFGVVFGLLFFACAVGLWLLKPWGRVLQVVLAIIGLIGFPVATVLSVMILVYMLRTDVKAVFSGRQGEELTPEEQAALAARPSTYDQVLSGCLITVIILATVAFVVMLIARVAMTALEDSIDSRRSERSVAENAPQAFFENAIDTIRSKQSAAEIRTLGTAVEAYKLDNGSYPPGLRSADELAEYLVPEYLRRRWTTDGWDRGFVVSSADDGSWIEIVSLGSDGLEGDRPGGPTNDPDADIVFRNGEFIQWPAAMDE